MEMIAKILDSMSRPAERRHPAGRYAGILPAGRLEGGVAAGWKPALRAILLLLCALPVFAQTEVVYRDDFQAYKVPSNPPGWVDTSIGIPKPEAQGLYKAWNDPLQGNQGTNVVYGTK